MSAMSDAVKNGPRMTGARTAHIEARIKLAEAKGKKAADQAAALRKRAKGDGPLAKSRQLRADAHQSAADRHRATANQLRADLAKVKADEAARHVKHVKRTVASSAAAGLTPNAAGQPGRAKAGQSAKRGGQAKPPGRGGRVDDEPAIRSRRTGTWNRLFPDPLTDTQRRFFTERDSGYTGWLDQDGHRAPDPFTSTPTKGSPAMTVSGEAVNIEQTRAMLAQIKTQVGELRGSMENASGSLASGGLNKLAGAFASADDPLDSVLTELGNADKHLADQEAIAEAAQAAGEMHTDTSFYG